jgi:3-methylcrotonyl-CoA carboxylase alpha subunit
MQACAMRLAKTAGYVNAGTVEFLMGPDGAFYFLEMNTRLQVEHPVTEQILGLDLVRLQIEVAAGRPLSVAQDQVIGRGHALECRLYAEDPWRQYQPSPGRLLYLSPPDGPGIRFDGGIAAGSEVTTHYDPLLAKVVTWGRDRAESVERMAEALTRTAILGVTTNLALLRAIVAHPAFAAGAMHTGFIDQHLAEVPRPACPPPPVLAAALAGAQRVGAASRNGGGPTAPDPWAQAGAWRLGA